MACPCFCEAYCLSMSEALNSYFFSIVLSMCVLGSDSALKVQRRYPGCFLLPDKTGRGKKNSIDTDNIYKEG